MAKVTNEILRDRGVCVKRVVAEQILFVRACNAVICFNHIVKFLVYYLRHDKVRKRFISFQLF